MTMVGKAHFPLQENHHLFTGSIFAALPIGLVMVAFGSHHAALLRELMPMVLPLCAVAIWFRSRRLYFGFLLTVWFLIPLLRRLVDHSAGPLDPNPMLLAPYLTTLAVPLVMLPGLLKAPIEEMFP